MSYKCPHCSTDIGEMVPYDRLQAATKQRDEARSELNAAQAKLVESEKLAGTATSLADQLKNLQGQLTESNSRYARDTAFLEVGLRDPSHREVFDMYFQRQAGAEGGEVDPAKWLASVTADPSKMPSALRASWTDSQGTQTPAQSTSQPTQAQAQPRATPPNSNAGAREIQGSPQVFTPESIRNMSTDQFKENYAAIAAAHPDLKLPPSAST